MSIKVQLKHVLIDVDFFDKPKCKALAYKHGYLGVTLLIRVYASLSRATNAVISMDTIRGLAYEMRIDIAECDATIDFCVSEGMISRDGESVTSERVASDQEKLATSQQGYRDRQAKKRASSPVTTEECHESVTRDNSDVSRVCVNNEQLNNEDLNTKETVSKKPLEPPPPKIERAPHIFLTDDEFEKLQIKLKPRELHYWIQTVSSSACQNPQSFKKKYRDHYRVILTWRVRQLETGKAWDETKGLYLYPPKFPPKYGDPNEAPRPKSRDVKEILKEQLK